MFELTLPASLTHIGEDAFKAVTGLDSFSSLAVTPPVIDGDGFFTNASTRHAIKVYVPENSVDAYRSANVWCDFEILPIESGVESIMSDATVTPVYYNLQGIRVENPEHGTYIRVSGNRAVKIRL